MLSDTRGGGATAAVPAVVWMVVLIFREMWKSGSWVIVVPVGTAETVFVVF